ncbi:hypothetical protein O6H91_04G038300 [Diphasiastrum complanatum]|nr:hypothetical protein O6H91_04G038300 [Diphasiastrum complanatum]
MVPGTVQRSTFSWTVSIEKTVKNGEHLKALKLYQEMLGRGVHPDKFTFVWVLKACASLKTLEEGMKVHKNVIRLRCESDVFVASCLVDMYAKCGEVDKANQVFNTMKTQDLVSWNALIMGYVNCGQEKKAIKLFHQMQLKQVDPDRLTFVGVLNACAGIEALEEGKQVHAVLIARKCMLDLFLLNCLVTMYCKCGSIEDAWRVFKQMGEHDIVSWNAMISGYAKCGQGERALKLFRQMQQAKVQPDKITFVGVLNACANAGKLEEGRRLHAEILRSGLKLDLSLTNCLIDMYAKCESLIDACRVFDSMERQDVVSWNIMIMGSVKCRQAERSLQLYLQMQQEGVKPNMVTFMGALKASGMVGALEEGRHIHAELVHSRCELDTPLQNSLIDMHAKCGRIEDAMRVFNNMGQRDIVSWNTILMAFVNYGQGEKALELFQQMEQEPVAPDRITFVAVLQACSGKKASKEGKWIHSQIIRSGYMDDIVVGSCLVDMYLKCKSIDDAFRVFKTMPVHDLISWNTMIVGLVKCGQGKKALTLFRQLEQEPVKPDRFTFIGAISACASIAALEEGKRIHAKIIQSKWDSDIYVLSCLIDMYAKCGSIQNSSRIFTGMLMRDTVSWSAMLGGYAMHGLGKETLQLFEQMCQENVQMDSTIFISLLSACSHAGLLYEAYCYFETLTPVYGILATIELYSCLIDLLGRLGYLSEAEDTIIRMPCQPEISVLMALLAACRTHGNVQIAERVATRVFKLDPESSSGYVLLSNIYATSTKV